MSDQECIGFLQWALPRLSMRWVGYRKVRRQVCRRVRRRVSELGLDSLASYRAYLETEPTEWALLDGLTHITISRFYRDREVFDELRADVLPELATTTRSDLSVWSAGAAGGEEPGTLALIWNFELKERFPRLRFSLLATDVDEAMLERARAACYDASSAKELPGRWVREGFTARSGRLCLRREHRDLVVVQRHDVRDPPPATGLDLVLCRNLAFTYFDHALQVRVARTLASALRPGGALVVGTHEAIPRDVEELEPWRRWIYRTAE